VAVSAIRYYERRGLLPPTERVGGQRRYTDAAVRRLEIIGTAKQVGFSLAEVRSLLDSTDRGATAREALRAMAGRKLVEVDAMIEDAQRARDWLAFARACKCKTLERCPLFA
jgi:MerR family redox-sensitive transcriptional activator SoxR